MNSPIPGDELAALSAFAIVADERSFTKAAVRLGVSRSAVSHSVQALEERLGLRLLARTTRTVAPAYFDVHPRPRTPRDLTAHRCLRYRMGADGPVYRWEFEKRGKPVTVSVAGPLTVNDAEFMIRAALDGVGLAFALEDYVADHIARGDLVRVLEDFCPPFDGYFLYYPSRRHQPPALQALVEALRV